MTTTTGLSMLPPDPDSFGRTLREIRQGVPGAVDEAFPQIYGALRDLAEGFMRGERPQHTLQPTALVHEAYLRLAAGGNLDPADRSQFLAIAAGAMRRALVDHARTKNARKRGGDWQRVTLNEDLAGNGDQTMDILDLDRVLNRLEDHHQRMCQVVELKFFVGLNAQEIGEVLGVSARTVGEDWSVAKLWLSREMRAGDPS